MLGLIRMINDILISFESIIEGVLTGVPQNIVLSGTAGGSTLSARQCTD